jgi:hypothetical protein
MSAESMPSTVRGACAVLQFAALTVRGHSCGGWSQSVHSQSPVALPGVLSALVEMQPSLAALIEQMAPGFVGLVPEALM